MTEIPKSHPRYASLVARERVAEGVKRGYTSSQGLIAQGKTMIMVTHSLDLAVRGSRVVEIRDGRITNDVPAALHPRARRPVGSGRLIGESVSQ